jgi:hypothetical protein
MMKWIVLMAGMIAMARTAPVAEPEAFFLPGPLAIPSLTGVALVDGLLLGKVALLKAAILANLLLDQGEEVTDSYGAPEAYGAPAETYGAPAVSYEPAPAPTYEYAEPAVSAYEVAEPVYEAAPAVDTYGSPAADPISAPAVDTYGSPAADPISAPAEDTYGAPAPRADPVPAYSYYRY